ncbi:hypothetical protein PRIPAC_88800, partial [Pristionchus pacificus]
RPTMLPTSTLLLLLVPLCFTIPFQPLRILIIKPNEGDSLPPKIDKALEMGVARIQEAINVAPLIDHIVKSEDLLKCLQIESGSNHIGTTRMLLSQNAITTINTVSLNNDIALKNANFAILVDINKERCDRETELMASATPCYVRDGHRPAIARIRVCPQLDRWMEFLQSQTASDVFRHELLHALGWGTVVPPKNSTLTPADIPLNWSIGTTVQTVVRKFVDFGNSATDFARIHFNCSRLEGIETEREDKIHLSEYIFGNELMSPVISTSANYFTEISARILEETHLGSDQWYSVNRAIISQETSLYSYGRGWGCKFVRSSCYDYIESRLRLGRSTFPFCSSFDYNRPDHSIHICHSTNHQSLKCDNLPMEPLERSSNGLTPLPMANIFPNIPMKLYNRMPSGSETRFCPFIQAISADTPFSSPPINTILPC